MLHGPLAGRGDGIIFAKIKHFCMPHVIKILLMHHCMCDIFAQEHVLLKKHNYDVIHVQ